MSSDLSRALQDLAEDAPTVGDVDAAMSAATRRRRQRRSLVTIAAVALAAVGITLAGLLPAGRPPQPAHPGPTGHLLPPIAPLPPKQGNLERGVADRNGTTGGLHAVDPTNGQRRTIVPCPASCRVDHLAWTVDGTRLAWSVDESSGGSPRPGVYVVAAGSPPEEVSSCAPPRCAVSSLAWSADGSTLALGTVSRPPLDNHANQLILASEDGVRRGFDATDQVGETIVWAPVGNRFVWWSELGFDLGVAGSDGPLHQVTTRMSFETMPTWAPDGQHLLFRSGGHLKMTTADGGQINVVDVPWPWAGPEQVYWSPTSQQIGFVTRTRRHPDTGFAVWLASAADGRVTKLGSGPAQTRQLVWAPDGSALAVGIRQDGPRRVGSSNGVVMTLPVTGAAAEPLPVATFRQWMLAGCGRGDYDEIQCLQPLRFP